MNLVITRYTIKLDEKDIGRPYYLRHPTHRWFGRLSKEEYARCKIIKYTYKLINHERLL